jgi:hypothetical protein
MALTKIGLGVPQICADGKRRATYNMQCYCGAAFTALAYNINTGKTRSCGCLRRVTAHHAGMARATLGCTTDPAVKRTRSSWKAMMDRCYKPVSTSYRRYGAVGITVATEWHTFPAFYAAMGLRPGPEYSLDRIDGAKKYEPGNVRWATRAEQARNKKSTVYITHNGVTLCATDWAISLGVCPSTVLRRNLTNKNPDGSSKESSC